MEDPKNERDEAVDQFVDRFIPLIQIIEEQEKTVNGMWEKALADANAKKPLPPPGK